MNRLGNAEAKPSRPGWAGRLCFLLILFLLLPCASCGAGREELTEPDSAAQTKEEPMGYPIFVDGVSYYSFAPDDWAKILCAPVLSELQPAFEARFGAQMTGSAHNIFLRAEGDKREYSCRFDPETGDITVTAGGVEALERALYTLYAILSEGNHRDVYADERLQFRFSMEETADNSSLLSYIPTERVRLIPGNQTGTLQTPEWVQDLILVELRPEMASIGGDVTKCRPLLDFYASVGVNGLWLCPIYERGGGNGYGNLGPEAVEPAISGTQDPEAGWANMRDFVSYAHEKGIYVFFDVITWGTVSDSPLRQQHPDWYEGEAWGGDAFNWKNQELREWFVSVCTENILKTGADGFRCDCEPFTSGYDVFGQIRDRLAAQGKHILVISEDGSDRSRTYDFEQDGVLKYSAMTRGEYYQKPVNFFADGLLDLVDSVKNGTGLGYAEGQKNPALTGTGRFYTNCITNHDFEKRNVLGNRLKIGYAAILAPFIPVWYMGDEFNANCPDGVQYFNRVNYGSADVPENRFFFEDVKRYIAVRRSFPELFAVWPMNHRDSNVCRVQTEGFGSLGAYARYAADCAVLVVPNADAHSVGGTVSVPFADCGLDPAGTYRVTDLMTDRTVVTGSAEETGSFYAAVRFRHIGVYLVRKVG